MYKFEEICDKVNLDCGFVIEEEEEDHFMCHGCGEFIYAGDYDDDIALINGYCPVCGEPLMEGCKKENFYD